jgi:hypothetical protein
MLFSRSITDAAKRDIQRLLDSRNADDVALIQEAHDLLVGFLRDDPHLQGIAAQASDFRVIVCGPVRVLDRVLPLEDRRVEICGVGANANWMR